MERPTGVLVQGTSIRDREFYFRQDERSTRIREAFALHVERMLKLGGIDSAGAGQKILAFETEAAVLKALGCPRKRR